MFFVGAFMLNKNKHSASSSDFIIFILSDSYPWWKWFATRHLCHRRVTMMMMIDLRYSLFPVSRFDSWPIGNLIYYHPYYSQEVELQRLVVVLIIPDAFTVMWIASRWCFCICCLPLWWCGCIWQYSYEPVCHFMPCHQPVSPFRDGKVTMPLGCLAEEQFLWWCFVLNNAIQGGHHCKRGMHY